MDNQTEPLAGGPSQQRRSRILVLAVAGLALAALIYAFAGSIRPTLRVGDPTPAFEVTTRAGLQIDSRMLRGSVVVVNFFASWCKPCEQEAADLEAVWQAHRDRQVLFIGITYRDQEADVAAFVAEHGLSFHIADDSGRVARAFGVTGVPETYVIDRQGMLVYKQLGAVEPAALRVALEGSLAR